MAKKVEPDKVKPNKKVKSTKAVVQKLTPKKRAMIEALEKSLGVVTTAAKKVDISRQTHYNWMAEDELYNTEASDLVEVKLDFMESALHRAIKEGNVAALIFALKTVGRSRGYTEKSSVDVTTNGENINAPVLITMSEAKKRLEDLDGEI